MGWFDFLFGKPRTAEPQPQFKHAGQHNKTGQQRTSPRCGHYTFAHYALRMVAMDRPLLFFAEMASPQATDFLAAVLKMVEEDCQERGESLGFSAADLKVETGRLVNHPLVVIEMPPPLAMTEAYYIGIVLLVDVDHDGPLSEKPPLRYFTLEQTLGEDVTPQALLCEWSNSAHMQCGECPISFDDFVRQIMSQL